jgi:hypothetical protein
MKRVRVGNGCGFWGDNLDAPIHLVADGRLNYLTLEYLAELTMSILALQRQRDPQAGYAHDFLTVLRQLTPHLLKQPQLKIVTNAGGMNPGACARQAQAILQEQGIRDYPVAEVSGDDLLPHLDPLLVNGHPLTNLDTGAPLESIRSRVISANAYLGAKPIAEGLAKGAKLVVTGRVADASLTVGPLMHEFGWSWTDWDRLCAATTAGHLIECGAQVTGGLWCHWEELEDLANVGYPIADCAEDGSFRIEKPAGTGGAINTETVAEQLLYEVIDPARYLTPDVVANFASVAIRESSKDVVEVGSARGLPATDSYKVSIAYRDGYMSSGTLVLAGPRAKEKAKLAGKVLLERLARAGYQYEESLVEYLGTGACVPGVMRSAGSPPEVVLRVAVRDPRKEAVERFTKEFAPLVTSGPPGVTGYTTGRPSVREVFAYWPALIAKSAVDPFIRVQLTEG